MANLLEQQSNSKHNMKIAMLNHEQTFRHQVYELHRLYKIQKVLMKNIKEKNRGKTEEEDEEDEENEEGEENEFIEESEIELTLGPSNYSNQIGRRRRRRRMKKLGENSDSSSSTTNGSAQKMKHFYKDGGFVNGSQMGFLGFLDVHDEIKLSNHHHPHHPNPWLCQVVSLNLT